MSRLGSERYSQMPREGKVPTLVISEASDLKYHVPLLLLQPLSGPKPGLELDYASCSM